MKPSTPLIQELSADLKPVRVAPNPTLLALIWFIASMTLVVLLITMTGPIRPEAGQQLLTGPRFLIENLLGLSGLSLLALAGFRSAIPGEKSAHFLSFGSLLTALWLSQYILGLWHPTLPPLMHGKRDACWLETLLFALPTMLSGLCLTRRLFPLQPLISTCSCCLVAGLLPALAMQVACMYLAPHILSHHILPGIAVAAVGILLSLTAQWIAKSRNHP